MSSALYRLGRFAARRPWTVIGLWVVLAATVIASSAAFGRQLEDSFAVPGLDSQESVELLSAAQSDRAGVTARVVATPIDGTTFTESAGAVAALEALRADLDRLPNVIGSSDPTAAGVVSADGTVALMTVQYPVLEELDRSDLEGLKDTIAEARRLAATDRGRR